MIQLAVQRGEVIYVYGANESILFTKYGQLVGFTNSSVSVKSGPFIYVFDDKGIPTNTIHA